MTKKYYAITFTHLFYYIFDKKFSTLITKNNLLTEQMGVVERRVHSRLL